MRGAKVTGSELEIVLRDAVQPLRVHLFYQPSPHGVLARWSRIENVGKAPLQVEQAASAVWNLPAGPAYSLSWLTGQWGAEWQLHMAPIVTGSQVLESRRGSTGHQANPWFAIGSEGLTTEESGPVWFGELAWSGSWRMNVEKTSLHHVRVTAGYNPFDFGYELKPGESLETPKFFAGYTGHGQGEASRILHRFQLAEVLPTHPDPKPRPVIYNSWGNLTKWTPDESDAAARLVTFYKSVRTTVQHGNLYRLKSPLQNEDSQVEYVAQDGSQAVLFAYLHSQHYGLAQPSVPLRGLDAEATYRVTPLDKAKYFGEVTVSGGVLMGQGVALGLGGDYDSTALMLERVP